MDERAVGIDLGTTFSVIAYLDGDGKPRTIPTAEGDLTCPSVVLFDEQSITVGKEAVKAASLEADHIADFCKRDMGKVEYRRKIRGQTYPPEVIQSLILEKLKRDAELVIGPFEKAVITVPAFYNEPRRQATVDAGQLAQLDVIDLINEPTAAALLYGIEQGFLSPDGSAGQKERILVYDLGGGTFDVTLMEISGHHFHAIATAGDVFLGGTDWDHRIVDRIADEFREKHRGVDPKADARGMQRLLREAEDAKRALSVRDAITVTFEHAGEGVRVPLTRDEFETMTEDLLERTIFTSSKLLREAGLQWTDLTRVLLVGGSTRMPAVSDRLEAESRLKIDRSLSADEAVAHGAAIYAGFVLAKQSSRPTHVAITNVNSHSLGVLARNQQSQVNRVLIPKNTSLPVTRTKTFKTARVGQAKVVIRVVEGEDPSGVHVTLIGTCVLANLPPNLPAGTHVEVCFTYSESGRLKVIARIPSIDVETEVAIERATGMTEEQKADWRSRR